MLLAPLNSGISVFLKKVRFSAVAFCLSSSLSLPQASFPHQDQTAFAFLSADSENREKKQALSVHLPLQAAQCQVNPKACIFSFYRLHSLLFDTMNFRFCCHFTCVFSLILLYDFLYVFINFLFFSLFIWSVYLIVPMSPRSPQSPRSPRSPYPPQSSHLYNFTVPEIFI